MIVKVKFIKEPERLEVFNFINLYFSRKHLQLRKLPVIHRLTSIRSISDFLLTKLHAHYPIKYLVRSFLTSKRPPTSTKMPSVSEVQYKVRKSRLSNIRVLPVFWIFKVKSMHRVAWMRQSRK